VRADDSVVVDSSVSDDWEGKEGCGEDAEGGEEDCLEGRSHFGSLRGCFLGLSDEVCWDLG
jgi:hypothetical protein